MTTTHPWTTDNRYGPGNSGASAPANAPAAYAARWIDKGNTMPAEVLPDRQGFAYNDKAEMEALIMLMGKQGDALRIQGDRKRDASMLVRSTDHWVCNMRRSGGYIYVDAWLTPPIANPPAADVESQHADRHEYVGSGERCRLCDFTRNHLVHEPDRTCQHCGRSVVLEDGRWIDPEATGDDAIWRETCDAHDTFTAEHEPEVTS